jgi:hypothetical protein
MDGAMESGRYVAHQVLQVLGHPHVLPVAVEAPPPPAYPEMKERPAADVHDFAQAMLAHLNALPDTASEGFGAGKVAPGRAFGAFLYEQVRSVLVQRAHDAAPPDHMAILAAIRDFTASALLHVDGKTGSLSPADQKHIAALPALLEAIFARIGELRRKSRAPVS